MSGKTGDTLIRSLVLLIVLYQCYFHGLVTYDVNGRSSRVKGKRNSVLFLQLFINLKLFQNKNVFVFALLFLI